MISGLTEAGTILKSVQLRLTLLTAGRSRTLVLPPAAVAVLLGLLPMGALLVFGAACYLMFHDDLLADLTRRQIAMQYGYEDHLAELRHEITNLKQQAKNNEAQLSGRLSALAQKQSDLESRTTLVADLAERATALHGKADAAQHGTVSETNPLLSRHIAPSLPEAASAYAGPQNGTTFAPAGPAEPKPQPEGFELRLEDRASVALPVQPSADSASLKPLSLDFHLPLATRLDHLAARQDDLDQRQVALLSDLQQPAARIAHRLEAAFEAAGIEPDQLPAPAAEKSGGTGGPFVPLPTTSAEDAAFARAAAAAQSAIASAEKLRLIADYVPFASPLPGRIEVTSPFGPRIDPFLGRAALHTGVDLRQDYGAPVRATAAGVISFAGSDGGYGNLIEIDHGNGLSTRYAHLSSLTVRQGQKVEAGTIVGRIGETGRATGPHLHYETRIDGIPVNPERFLKAGLMLHLARATTEL